MNSAMEYWLNKHGFRLENGVWVNPSRPEDDFFAPLYHELRTKEGRIPADAELLKFPEVARNHPHFSEWKIRKASAEKVLEYSGGKRKPRTVLDVGCGNGWFSNLLVRRLKVEVIATDLNLPELEQGARVFGSANGKLFFVQNDLMQLPFPAGAFDAITVGAAIQYFPDLGKVISALRELLAPDGEIHVFDSPFYSYSELQAAKLRSDLYYSRIGFPELCVKYHHHSREDALRLGGKMLYDPQGGFAVLRKLFNRSASPFPWWVFKAR